MKLKKYMLIDLSLLIGIGVVIEALGIFAFNFMLRATVITSAVSLLVMVVAITRWRWKGLICAPFLALATLISGRFFNPHLDFRSLYGWELYLSTLGSLLSLSVNLIWFKYIDYNKTFKSIGLSLGLCLMDIFVSQLTLSLLYMAFTASKDFLILGFLAWNAFSFVLLLVGVYCFKRQNVLIDVEVDMKEKSQERIDDSDFRLNIEEENVEKEKGDLKDGESS
ncbi:MAG: hypothetical protein K2M84_06780 [Anaeroplasmataceae bacterium]|nr:hypothetical protein [Anaeroplasmataceae bacterium]